MADYTNNTKEELILLLLLEEKRNRELKDRIKDLEEQLLESEIAEWSLVESEKEMLEQEK